MFPSQLKTVSLVTAGAVLTVLAVDFGLQRLSPVKAKIIEVDDGVAAYEASDPDILVLGSSHARSFVPLRDEIAAATSGRQKMVLVPVEWGTFDSYRWVLENRLRPIIEEREGDRLKRSHLARVVLVTMFYDLCRPDQVEHVAAMLAARAWRLRDFLADIGRNGATKANRNYLLSRFKNLFPFSILVQDRGYQQIFESIRERARNEGPAEAFQRELKHLPEYSARVENDFKFCHSASQRKAFEEIVDYFQSRQVEVTVVLFPLWREKATDLGKATTIKEYADYVDDVARRKPGLRVVDMTLNHPLALMDDAELDLDHVNAQGNRKFAPWALQNGLGFLLQPVGSAPGPGGAAPMGGAAGKP